MNTFGNHKINQIEDKLIIELDINQLVHAVENIPSYECKIVDRERFIQYITERIFEFTNDYNDDPLFFRVFDNLVIDAYENAEEFVEYE